MLSRAREAVKRGRAASVSAYVTAAPEERVKLDELEEMLGRNERRVVILIARARERKAPLTVSAGVVGIDIEPV